MDRRKFIVNGCGLTSGWLLTGDLNAMMLRTQYSHIYSHRLPANDGHY